MRKVAFTTRVSPTFSVFFEIVEVNEKSDFLGSLEDEENPTDIKKINIKHVQRGN